LFFVVDFREFGVDNVFVLGRLLASSRAAGTIGSDNLST